MTTNPATPPASPNWQQWSDERPALCTKLSLRYTSFLQFRFAKLQKRCVSQNNIPPPKAPNNVLRLCKKVFAAFGGRIFFGWRLVFHDFASRNHEKQVSIQILFGAKRRKKPFYTTSQNKILPLKAVKYFSYNPFQKVFSRRFMPNYIL